MFIFLNFKFDKQTDDSRKKISGLKGHVKIWHGEASVFT